MPIFSINGRTVLFIHVPKTGGTTLERLLAGAGPMGLHSERRSLSSFMRSGWASKPVPLQHLHGAILERLFHPRQFDHVFMVVRNPVDRMISEYRHARALHRPEARLPFPAWLRASLIAARFDAGFRNNHFRPQSHFAFGDPQVLYFEDGIPAIANHIARTLGLPEFPDIPRERASDPFPADATERDRALVARAFRDDYAAFPRYAAAATVAAPPLRPALQRTGGT